MYTLPSLMTNYCRRLSVSTFISTKILPHVNPRVYETLLNPMWKISKVEIEHPHGTLQLVWDNGLSLSGLSTRNRRKHMKS